MQLFLLNWFLVSTNYDLLKNWKRTAADAGSFLLIIAMMKETKLQRYQPKMMMMIIIIIVVDTTGSIDPRG